MIDAKPYMDICEQLSSENASLRSQVEALKAALKPFAEFASVSVDAESRAWNSTIHREPVSTWFGPSDFHRARSALENHQEATGAPKASEGTDGT